MVIVAGTAAVCVLIFFMLCAVANIQIRKKQYIAFSFILIGSLAFVAFFFQAGAYNRGNMVETYHEAVFDVVRYHIEIESYRNMRYANMLQALKTTDEPLRILLFYCLGKLQSDHWISVLSVGCALSVFTMLVGRTFFGGDQTNDKKVGRCNTRRIAFTYLLLFAAISYMDMINTCRYVIAYSLIAFALIQMFMHERRILGYLLIAIASLLHISGWLILAIVISMEKIPFIYKFRHLLLFWQGGVLVFGFFLQSSHSSFLENLGLYITDTIQHDLSGRRIVYWCVLTIAFILLLVMVHMAEQRVQKKGEEAFLKIIEVLLLAMAGGWGTTLAIRWFFLVAFLSPVFLSVNGTEKKTRKQWVLKGILALAFMGCCIYNALIYGIYIQEAGAYWGRPL